MKNISEFCEISDCTGKGYAPVVDFGGWRVAVINYDSNFNKDSISMVERHNQTDEVFVLLEGRAVLIFASKVNMGEKPGDKNKTGDRVKIDLMVNMEGGKIYNVKKGVFHTITLTMEAKVLIVENLDTTTENSEYIDLSPEQTQQLADDLFKED